MITRARIQIGVPFLVLVALIVATVNHYNPAREELVKLAEDVASAEAKLTYVVNHASELQNVAEFLPPERKEGDEGDQQFLLKMSGKLRELGLIPRTVQPKGEAAHGDYMKRVYLVELDCGYTELIEFLAYIEQLPELVIVEWLDLRSSEVSGDRQHRVVIRFSVVSR